ncbi:MAG TPA: M24 family metallopeptidase, partial [Thermomicrobiales bacterium]|nr:M24 family metallopeptidase [Thermomicrobiales bacterium]
PGDLAYLTNHFPPFPTTVFSEQMRGMGHAFLILPVAGEPILVTDPRGYRHDLVPIERAIAAADLGAAVVAALRDAELDRSRVALADEDILPAAFAHYFREELPALDLVPDDSIVSRLRRIKSPAEQQLLREAARCADAGLRAAVARIGQPGVTERDVCAAGAAAAIEAGADFVRYFRVHSGPWSAAGSRWPPAMDRVIEPGDVVAMDVIGAFGGYGFDVNRTTVKGAPDARARALLDAVDAATAAAVARCTAGASVAAVVAAGHGVLREAGFADYMGRMIGHGIGLETVEAPYLLPDVSEQIEPGMTLCIEPGASIPGWAGASIEQEIIVTAGAPEIITPTPTRLW